MEGGDVGVDFFFFIILLVVVLAGYDMKCEASLVDCRMRNPSEEVRCMPVFHSAVRVLREERHRVARIPINCLTVSCSAAD